MFFKCISSSGITQVHQRYVDNRLDGHVPGRGGVHRVLYGQTVGREGDQTAIGINFRKSTTRLNPVTGAEVVLKAASDGKCPVPVVKMLVSRKLKDAVVAFQMTSDIWGRTSLQAAGLGCKITALARDATPTNQNLAQFLHRLTEQELAVRAMDAVVARIKEAAFMVEKDYDRYDFSIMPHLQKPKLIDLALCEWIHEK